MTGWLDRLGAAVRRRLPLRSGETYALSASLALRVRAGSQGPVRVIRCLGPGGEN